MVALYKFIQVYNPREYGYKDFGLQEIKNPPYHNGYDGFGAQVTTYGSLKKNLVRSGKCDSVSKPHASNDQAEVQGVGAFNPSGKGGVRQGIACIAQRIVICHKAVRVLNSTTFLACRDKPVKL